MIKKERIFFSTNDNLTTEQDRQRELKKKNVILENDRERKKNNTAKLATLH